MSNKINRCGEEKNNNFGSNMRIINYENNTNIDVYFPEYNWIAKNISYVNFKQGKVKCPYEKRFYNKGYMGEGKYNKYHKSFNYWHNMVRRCYDHKFIKRYPTYKDCEVCDEWLNFQNFAKWFEENYYEIENEKMCLDKDVLYKWNKIYSPETCVFVPEKINLLFVKRQNDRGELPIGVIKFRNKYQAKVNKRNKNYVKTFDDIEPAFNWYKIEKEKYIKETAEKYKEFIPEKLYKAMCNYKVEIND